MKHAVITLFLLGPSPSLLAQNSSQNYVLTQALLNASGSNKVTEVQYHDGLGRPEISVLLEDHPYTQAIMNDEFAIESQNVVRSRGSNGLYLNVGRSEFFPWQASLFIS